MYSCVPLSAPAMLRKKRFCTMRSACSAVGRVGAHDPSNVTSVSSIIAHSSPRHRRRRSGCGSVAVSPSARPRASASRRAGSIVTTTTRWSRRASSMPITAATVVLPTPPEPQHTTTVAPPSAAVEGAHRRSPPVGQRRCQQADVVGIEAGHRQRHELDDRRRDRLREAGDLVVLHRPARACGTPPPSAARWRRNLVRASARRIRHVRRASTPLTTTGPSRTPTRSSSVAVVSISSLTGVVSGSVTSTTWHRSGSASISSTSFACV